MEEHWVQLKICDSPTLSLPPDVWARHTLTLPFTNQKGYTGSFLNFSLCDFFFVPALVAVPEVGCEAKMPRVTVSSLNPSVGTELKHECALCSVGRRLECDPGRCSRSSE